MARKDSRRFIRLDLDYADHPKIAVLSDAAFRAHVEMIAYSRKYLTDGVIPQRVAKRFANDSLNELCSNDENAPSLCKTTGGDYILHGYADMNETRDEVEARSRANAENGKRSAAIRSAKRKRTVNKSLNESVNETGNENPTEIEIEIDNSSAIADVEVRDDVGRLLDRLDNHLRDHDVKLPARNKRNVNDMRLLIDRDGRTEDEIARVIDWCQRDPFWMSNIRSASKLREKYDQLKLKAGIRPTPQGGDQFVPDQYRMFN